MAADVHSRLPVNANSRDKLEALLTYAYQAGKWNFNRTSSYDFG